jgi:hypothetical protein
MKEAIPNGHKYPSVVYDHGQMSQHGLLLVHYSNIQSQLIDDAHL